MFILKNFKYFKCCAFYIRQMMQVTTYNYKEFNKKKMKKNVLKTYGQLEQFEALED